MVKTKFEFGTEGHANILLSKYKDSYERNHNYNIVDFNFCYDDVEIDDS